MNLKPTLFAKTRQGVRDLDQIGGAILPISGGPAPPTKVPNVGETERTLSILAGSGLIGLGLAAPSIRGALMGLAGGALLYRGLTGHCELYRALGLNTAATAGAPYEMAYHRG
jgi:uncharacterized membrane protein